MWRVVNLQLEPEDHRIVELSKTEWSKVNGCSASTCQARWQCSEVWMCRVRGQTRWAAQRCAIWPNGR